MEKKIKLTVFVAVYNHEKYIKKSLDSILNQNFNHSMEIICIDDCSSDRSAEIIREFYGDKIIFLKRKKNMGLTRNLYYAYTHARGEYFISLAGDDWLLDENALQLMTDFLDANADYGGVSYETDIYSEREKKIGEIRSQYSSFKLEDYLRGNDPGCYAGMTRTVNIIDNRNLKCIYKSARNNEEIASWIIRLESGPIYVLPKVLYAYRYVASGASNYNSTHTAKDTFLDNWKAAQYIELHYVPAHSCDMLKGHLIEKYFSSVHSISDIKDVILVLKRVGIHGIKCLTMYYRYSKK